MDMDFNELTELIENGIPFNQLLGVRVSAIQVGLVRLYIPFQQALIGDSRRPALHGGVISALVDTCAGFAVWTHCRLIDRIATIDLRVDYLRPAGPGDLYAEASVRLLGSRIGNAQVVVWTDGDRDVHVAEGRGVYNIRRGR